MTEVAGGNFAFNPLPGYLSSRNFPKVLRDKMTTRVWDRAKWPGRVGALLEIRLFSGLSFPCVSY